MSKLIYVQDYDNKREAVILDGDVIADGRRINTYELLDALAGEYFDKWELVSFDEIDPDYDLNLDFQTEVNRYKT